MTLLEGPSHWHSNLQHATTTAHTVHSAAPYKTILRKMTKLFLRTLWVQYMHCRWLYIIHHNFARWWWKSLLAFLLRRQWPFVTPPQFCKWCSKMHSARFFLHPIVTTSVIKKILLKLLHTWRNSEYSSNKKVINLHFIHEWPLIKTFSMIPSG